MEVFSDSIWAQPIFPPTWNLVSTSTDTTHSYSWVGKGGKLAIAEMSFDTLGVPKIFKWTELPGIGVGLEESSVDILEIYPNPCETVLTMRTQETKVGSDFSIMNALGMLVSTGLITEVNQSINIAHLAPGSYTFCVGEKHQHFIKQ